MTPTAGRRRDYARRKITVYLSADELLALDLATAHIRYRIGVRTDRSQIVREAIAHAVGDVNARSDRSWVVERLREIR